MRYHDDDHGDCGRSPDEGAGAVRGADTSSDTSPDTSTEELSDLVRAALDGDQNAWTRLVERFLPLVRSVIRWHGLLGQDAEDVSQIVWLRLIEHLTDVREPRALPGWIRTTTRNECMHALRSGKRTVPVGVGVEPRTSSWTAGEIDEDLLRAERHQILLQAMAELPGHQRALLTMLVADPPLSYAEISRRLGIPIGSIGPTRARALRRLREYYAVAALTEECGGAA